MTALDRIAQLHRELAEAYEQLGREQSGAAKPRRRPLVKVESEPSQERVDSVRRKLRRAGVPA